MSKLGSCKFLVVASIAFWLALAVEFRAKQLAGRAAIAHAEQVARSAPEKARSLAGESDSATVLGMVVAAIAGLFWGASAYRREPGSHLLPIIPALLYGGLFLLLV